MPVSLVILTQPGDARPRRELTVAPGVSILTAAHDGGVDVTATCGGRGRCTSCRVKFIEGTIPPPTIMDEIQLGDDLVREGYRLSCQCTVTEPITVQVAPPLDEQAFQILGAGPGVGGLGVRIDAGIAKELVKVSLPREEHHQTSDLEQLAAAVGVAPESVGPSILAALPQALRDDPAGVTVTTFVSGSVAGSGPGGAARTVVAVERERGAEHPGGAATGAARRSGRRHRHDLRLRQRRGQRPRRRRANGRRRRARAWGRASWRRCHRRCATIRPASPSRPSSPAASRAAAPAAPRERSSPSSEIVGPSILAALPQALRDDPAGVTVTTFVSGSVAGSGPGGAARTVVAVE